MVMWIVIAAVPLGLFILVVATLPLVRRLGTLRRAAVKLQRRQAEAMALRPGVARLEQTALLVLGHETVRKGLAVINPGYGGGRGKHALPGHR